MLFGCIKIFKIAILDILCKVHDKTKSRSFFMLFLFIILFLLHHHNFELTWTSSFLLPLLYALLLPLVPYPSSISLSFMHSFFFICHEYSFSLFLLSGITLLSLPSSSLKQSPHSLALHPLILVPFSSSKFHSLPCLSLPSLFLSPSSGSGDPSLVLGTPHPLNHLHPSSFSIFSLSL